MLKGNTQKGITQRGNTQKGVTQIGITQRANTQKGITQKGSTQRGIKQKGDTQKGNLQKGHYGRSLLRIQAWILKVLFSTYCKQTEMYSKETFHLAQLVRCLFSTLGVP